MTAALTRSSYEETFQFSASQKTVRVLVNGRGFALGWAVCRKNHNFFTNCRHMNYIITDLCCFTVCYP